MLKGKKNIIFGLLIYMASVALMLFAAMPVQMWLGLYGVGLSELMMLGLALLAWLISRRKFREVFPFAKPRAKQIGGSLLMWLGTFLGAATINYVLMSIFPEMMDVSRALSDIFSSEPLGVSILIVAFMAGICEEALFRGAILSTLDSYKSVALRVVLVGFLFAALHLDFYRFPSVFLLGMTLSYIMVKTQNLLLPMIVHTINNLLPTLVSSGVDFSQDVRITLSSPIVLGLLLNYGSISALCLYYGINKLRNVIRDARRKRINLIVTLCCCGVLAIGFFIYLFNFVMVFMQNYTGTM